MEALLVYYRYDRVENFEDVQPFPFRPTTCTNQCKDSGHFITDHGISAVVLYICLYFILGYIC